MTCRNSRRSFTLSCLLVRFVHGSSEDGVVEFVAVKLQKSTGVPPIRRPKPFRLSPHQEENDDDSSSKGTSDAGGAQESIDAEGSSYGDEAVSNDDDTSQASQSNEEDEAMEVVANDDSSNANARGEMKRLGATTVEIHDNTVQTQEEEAKTPPTKSKRVLSSNTLSQLNMEAGHSDLTPKKRRSSPEHDERIHEMSPPQFSLGACAINHTTDPLPNHSLMRGGSPAYSTEDELDLDMRLSEELHPHGHPTKKASATADPSGDISPVPLLTPPQSPVTVKEDGKIASLCEWPSNLVIDSAMMNLTSTETRPLSPASLQGSEDDVLADDFLQDDVKCPSSLTPLLKSIYVGTE